MLSPTFEDVIVIWCLEKIDNRLPSKVNQAFGHQLINNVTLKDIQKEVFKYIPIFLQELNIQESETIDLMKVKSEDDKQNAAISCDQEPKIKEDFLSDQENTLSLTIKLYFIQGDSKKNWFSVL